MTDPTNPNEYDESAYTRAVVEAAPDEDDIESFVRALWEAGGTPGDIRNEFEEMAYNAILTVSGPPHVGGGPKKPRPS